MANKQMFSSRIDTDLTDALKLEALSDHRSVANMLELILRERYAEAALTERGGLPGGRGLSGDGAAGNGDESRLPAAAAPRSVSPADVAATIEGVDTLRPHMRKDRPAVQCEARIAPGQTCTVCGAVVT